ncbi:hypothetical protein TNCV_4103421 [Trichonephila clavipes]|nr:hypothetical protein TNCV_4103421 [Trichonephila clavipes]
MAEFSGPSFIPSNIDRVDSDEMIPPVCGVSQPPYFSSVDAAENRFRLGIEDKTFVGREKLSFYPFQKEKCNYPTWPLSSMTDPTPQFIPSIQSILSIVVYTHLGNLFV